METKPIMIYSNRAFMILTFTLIEHSPQVYCKAKSPKILVDLWGLIKHEKKRIWWYEPLQSLQNMEIIEIFSIKRY